MSRGAASRRRGALAPTWEEESPGVAVLVDDTERRAERLDAENTRLRDALTEVEAWYRLLQADHASLQARHGQVGRKAAQIQAEADRLESKNRELEALVDRPVGPAQGAGHRKEGTLMNRIKSALRAAGRHKWASAALVAFATLLARGRGRPGRLLLGRGQGPRPRRQERNRRDFSVGFRTLREHVPGPRGVREGQARLQRTRRQLEGRRAPRSSGPASSHQGPVPPGPPGLPARVDPPVPAGQAPVPKEAMEEFASLKNETK